MRYFVTVDGEEHEVELALRLGRLEVRVDGAELDAAYQEVDRLGQVALFLGEESFGVSIEGDEHDALVTVAGHVHVVRIEDEREKAAHAADRGRASGAEVRSVMPGIVVSVLVAEGQQVAAGEPLLIVEAMKMQNEIPAPVEGRVAGVHVAEGATVRNGELLVSLEAAEEPSA